MSRVITVLAVILAVSFSACAKKVDEYHYNRAKNASDKAMQSLDRE
ncbi:hypothetical protein [Sulfurimonas denitrificans]|jgi:hypothetical protein|nr:hypothetical protein [Sulfurimonas denitrificans]MDD3442189.1 hypothetical protein [Sulfurimonas denitrificans]